MQIVKLLLDGVNSCLGWFWDIMSLSDMWTFYITSFILVCIGSLVSPFVFRIGSGFSDHIQNSKAVFKNGEKRRLTKDEKWVM